MPVQHGAYLALSRKFCRQVNIHSTIKFFSRVRQTRNTNAIVSTEPHFTGPIVVTVRSA
jgi:hypothetical protein